MKKNLHLLTTLLMANAMIFTPINTVFATEVGNTQITDSTLDENISLEINKTDILDSSVLEDDIDPAWIFTKKYIVTGNDVNIRTGPGTSYPVVGTLYKNDVIYIKSIDNGWAKFKYNSQWRYVSSTYIKEA